MKRINHVKILTFAFKVLVVLNKDGLKKPVRYQRPNRFSTTYFRTTKVLIGK